MSKTSIKERNKAIRLAWEREQKLVAEGNGTRDWSEDQQKDILDPAKGKAYDENGRAFEGQHMKSAAEYPDYQGDPDNIQFLTREEHLEAHKGCWQNLTNWYYNPQTKEFVDFGDNRPIPCSVIKLSNPIPPIIEVSDNSNKQGDAGKLEVEKVAEPGGSSQPKETPHQSEKAPHESTTITPTPGVRESYSGTPRAVSQVLDAVRKFGERHPIIAGIVKWGGVVAFAIGTEVVKNSSSGGGGSGNGGSDYSSPDSSEGYSSPLDDNNHSDPSRSGNYSDETEKMYTPNDVPAGKQRYHYKDGSVKWKDKQPYHRGGNNGEK